MLRRPTAVALLCCALAVAAPTARAQPTRASFALRATATGTEVLYEVRGLLPVDRLVESSALFAEAHLERSRSTSLAAAPNPGSTALSAPGLIDGFSGKTDVPDYPLAARAEHPLIPEAKAGAGTIALVAHAAADAADGEARQSGAEGGDVRASADTGADRVGRLVARAVSSASNLSSGDGAISVGSVTSVVELAIGDHGPEVVENRTTVSDLRVGGVPVIVGDDGVIVADQAVDLGPAAGVLGQQGAPTGLTVRVTGPVEHRSDGGLEVTSGTLVVELPGEVQGSPSMFRVVLGQASAAVSSIDRPAAAETPVAKTTIPTRPAPAAVALFTPVTAGGGGGLLAVPAIRPSTPGPSIGVTPVSTVPPLDFRPVYLWLAGLGVAAVRLQRWVLAQAREHRQASDLRPLWRW